GTAAYPLEQLVGEAEVIEVPAAEVITAADWPMTMRERVLVKTRNSQTPSGQFDPTFVALDESAAIELVRRGVVLIGVDGPSVKKRRLQNRVHGILLEAGVVVLEGLRLADVSPGMYELLCLPLPVDLDGAPVRAVLRR
ncbi:MAG: cyclase family protein, partial [Patescibacteria group bacterium]